MDADRNTAFEVPPGLIHHYLETSDGRKLHVAEFGSGPILIFIHGWPEFWKSWLPLVNVLGPHYRCLMPCLYGFGLSDKPEALRDNVDALFHAQDIALIADKLCDQPVTLIGHDIGGYVLQALGGRHDALGMNIKGLIFFNCPTSSVGTKWVEGRHVNEIWYQSFHLTELAQNLVGYNRDTTAIYIRHFLNHWSVKKDCFAPVFEEWVDNFIAQGALRGGFSWYNSNNEKRLNTLNGKLPPPDQKITLPSAVLWGRHDPILKSDWAEFLDDHFEIITYEFAEDSGHFVHVEETEACANFIEKTIAKWQR
ncbi:MAG: alpha/beta hydrolase [Alphaproteobacteria bacterium]|nr:alpha/beta hydrolase [Alphaproteobacteria bacterium]